MIFPDIRRSTLERDVAEKRAALEISKSVFINQVRSKAKPLSFVKNHPKLILGLLFTAFSGTKILTRMVMAVVGMSKRKWLWKLLMMGWSRKLIKKGLFQFLKTFSPLLAKSGNTLIKSILKEITPH